jgi:pimeloyl-ACP methyl ester carboxylesterase
MGGMIAQRVAIAAPERVLSLTSIMSSSGARGLPQARPEVMRALLSRPANNTQAAAVDQYVRLFKAIGSPAYPTPEPEMRERILVGVQRSFHPVGTLRQMLAIVSDTTRAAQLERIVSPTLVLHGRADPLVPFVHGEDTAQRIAGAQLVGIDGMGHDLPPEPVALMLDALIPHLQTAQLPVTTPAITP